MATATTPVQESNLRATRPIPDQHLQRSGNRGAVLAPESKRSNAKRADIYRDDAGHLPSYVILPSPGNRKLSSLKQITPTRSGVLVASRQ